MQLRPAEIKFAEEEAKRGAASRAAELAVSRKALAERQRQLGELRTALVAAEELSTKTERERQSLEERMQKLQRLADEHEAAKRSAEEAQSRRRTAWASRANQLEDELSQLRIRTSGLQYASRSSQELSIDVEARLSRVREAEASAMAHSRHAAEILRTSIARANGARDEALRTRQTAEHRKQQVASTLGRLNDALRAEEERVNAGRTRVEAEASKLSASEASLRHALDTVSEAAAREARSQHEREQSAELELALRMQHERRTTADLSRHAATAASKAADTWLNEQLLRHCRQEARALSEELAERKLNLQRFLLQQDVNRTPPSSVNGDLSSHKLKLAGLEGRSRAAQLAVLRAELEAGILHGS